MSSREPKARVWIPDVGEVATDKVRFGIGDAAGNLLSGQWTVSENNGHFYVSGSGLTGSMKFSFHKDILNWSFVQEAHSSLVERGIAPADSRHVHKIPIPAERVWCGLSIAFPHEFLRNMPQAPKNTSKRPTILLPKPAPGRMYKVAFLLTNDSTGHVRYEDPSDLYLGRVSDGRDRSLLMIGRALDYDVTKMVTEARRVAGAAKLPLQVEASIDPDADLAMLLFSAEPAHLSVVEVHNVRKTPLSKQAAPADER